MSEYMVFNRKKIQQTFRIFRQWS